MFSINFERASLKISDKVWNLTINLVKKVLENAGMDEGEWCLKLPHRTRKKGNERFKSIRQDHNGKVRGIRIRCKPAGNDTCFEYTLVPPSGTDMDTLFNLLSRVHPKNLDIYDTLALKAAIQYPEIRELGEFAGTQLILPLKKENFSQNYTQEKTHSVESSEIADTSIEPVTKKDISEAISVPNASIDRVPIKQNDVEKISSLALTEPLILSDQEAMDKALIAMAIVSHNGYAKRTAASGSIIQHLDILNFIEKISAGTYVSVEGAMRALTMALRKNNYIERIHCSPSSDAVKGYKITYKGEKRILSLKRFLSNDLLSKIDHNWIKFTEEKEEYIETIENTVEESKQVETPIENELEHYERLESLISSLREANNQIVEANGFIDNLNSEKTDLSVELFGIEKAIEEQIKCKQEIEKRIAKFQEKKEEIKIKVGEKEKEIEDWKKYQSPYMSEKDRLKKEIETLAGSVGIGVT